MTFHSFAQNSAAIKALIDDAQCGRMAHATLLVGEEGIGKNTLARLLAKALLCNGEGEKPCQVCRACKRFDARTHPDLLFAEPLPREKSIKIEALRQVLDALSRHALEGVRAVLIEDAQRMTPQAQNCLLKNLEESESDTYFILTATKETLLLPTVRSRCRVVRMQPWAAEQIENMLLAQGIEAPRARQLAALCEGSIGRAQSMHADSSYWAQRELVEHTFMAVKRPQDAPRASQALKDKKDEGNDLLDILEQETRTALHAVVQSGAAPQNPAWQHATPGGLMRILDAVMEMRRMRGSNVNWQATAERLIQIIAEEVTTWQQ